MSGFKDNSSTCVKLFPFGCSLKTLTCSIFSTYPPFKLYGLYTTGPCNTAVTQISNEYNLLNCEEQCFLPQRSETTVLNDIKMSYNNTVHVSKFYFVCLFYEMQSPPILRVLHFFHKHSSIKTSCKTLKKIGIGTSFFQKSNYIILLWQEARD